MRAQASRRRYSQGSRTRRLSAEPLESRRLLAGNVSVNVAFGTLFISGDNADNWVSVSGTGTSGQFVVQGLNDSHGAATSINHTSDGTKTVNGVNNIVAVLKGGDDFFEFGDANLRGSMLADMGEGNDQVEIGPVPCVVTWSASAPTVKPLQATVSSSSVTIGGALVVNLGSGNNWLMESSTHVKCEEHVNGGNGNDDVTFTDNSPLVGLESLGTGVFVDRDLELNLGGGTNSLDGYDLTVGGSLRMNACGENTVDLSVVNIHRDAIFNLWGSGAQDLFIGRNLQLGDGGGGQENHVGGNLTVHTGCGNDTVTESSLTVGGCNLIDTERGNDMVLLGDDPRDDQGEEDEEAEPNDANQVTVAHDLIVRLGDNRAKGTDELAADNVHVGGDFIVKQGQGDSDIELENLQVAHWLKITTEGGCDIVDLEDVTADKLWIDTGAGNDSVTLEAEGSNTFRTAQVYLGPGNDSLAVSDTTVTQSTLFDGGTGSNTYDDGGGNSLAHLTKLHF
jgi:hypothetical protein